MMGEGNVKKIIFRKLLQPVCLFVIIGNTIIKKAGEEDKMRKRRLKNQSSCFLSSYGIIDPEVRRQVEKEIKRKLNRRESKTS